MKQEINLPYTFTDDEGAKLEMHSIRNILSVLMGNIEIIRSRLKDPDCLERSLQTCHTINQSLDSARQTLTAIQQVGNYRKLILSDIAHVLATQGINPGDDPLIDKTQQIIHSVLEVLDVRVLEMLTRSQNHGRLEPFSIEQLKQSLFHVFRAIEQNSQGRYRIALTPQEKTENDYLVTLDFQSIEGPNILMPEILQDSIRDLAANARKYTPPGGTISITFVDDGTQLTLTVADTGRGIPPEEIPKVVEAGYRASNTTPDETNGDGYGLTKAYYITKKYGGRMWIESEIDKGTTITLTIPR